MTSANEYGEIWLGLDDRGGARGRYVAIKPRPSGREPISFNVGAPCVDVGLSLTVEEARAVLAQLEAVIEEVDEAVTV